MATNQLVLSVTIRNKVGAISTINLLTNAKSTVIKMEDQFELEEQWKEANRSNSDKYDNNSY